MFDFISFGIADCIDILLFAIILYYLYRLLRGTAAIRIFWTIAILYILWKVLSAMHFNLVSGVVGQILSVGIVAIIIVFQPEIRKFLLMIGNARILTMFRFRKKEDMLYMPEINAVVRACRRMSNSKTGALIVFEKKTPLDECIATGEKLDAIVFLGSAKLFRCPSGHDEIAIQKTAIWFHIGEVLIGTLHTGRKNPQCLFPVQIFISSGNVQLPDQMVVGIAACFHAFKHIVDIVLQFRFYDVGSVPSVMTVYEMK